MPIVICPCCMVLFNFLLLAPHAKFKINDKPCVTFVDQFRRMYISVDENKKRRDEKKNKTPRAYIIHRNKLVLGRSVMICFHTHIKNISKAHTHTSGVDNVYNLINII